MADGPIFGFSKSVQYRLLKPSLASRPAF